MSREPLDRPASIAWTVIFCLSAAFWIGVIGWVIS
jgi:hypothetical protein